MPKLKVAVLGERGLVGQMYVERLTDHPYFDLTGDLGSAGVIFSALPDCAAQEEESKYAAMGKAVFSSASYHRLDSDIPLIIPEVNPEHLDLIPIQQKKRGWDKGFIVAKPNCTLQSYLLPLFPLHQKFQLKKLMVTTLQSTSGAGRAFELEGNVLPYIADEEEKSEREPLKILGSLSEDGITPLYDIGISTHCNRVPVPHGHLACVSCSFEVEPNLDKVIALWNDFPGLSLPSAPMKPLQYIDDLNRPQPALDVGRENGMAVTIGRLRPCNLFHLRFVALSHNLIRGAAGAGVLTAELAYQRGLL